MVARILVVFSLLVAPSVSGADVRLDLELPGVSQSFDFLWSVGEGGQTLGIATDASGSIYTTVNRDLVSLSASGVEQWRVVCPAGGCRQVTSNGDAVFGSFAEGGMVRVDPSSGTVECTYLPEDVGTRDFVRDISSTASYVAIQHPVKNLITVIDAASCTELYRIGTPNDQKAVRPYLDEDFNVLSIAWDDSDFQFPFFAETHHYALDTGAHRCQIPTPPVVPASADENFRGMLFDGRYFALLTGSICEFDAVTCAWQGRCYRPEGDFHSGIGDLRDIAYDPGRNRFYAMGNSQSNWGLFEGVLSTLKHKTAYRDFVPNGLFTLNDFAIGGDWIFVPDGVIDEKGSIQVFDLDRIKKGPFARFERGRVTRLAGRLIDGGLLLTQNQRENDTPLNVFRVGDGSFVGHGTDEGGSDGDKYCSECLTRLRYLEADCEDSSEGWSCALTNHYATPVVNPTFTLPWGEWEVRNAAGTPIGSTDDGEVVVSLSLPGGASTNLTIAGDVFLIPGKRLVIKEDLFDRPEKRFFKLTTRDGVRVPPPGPDDPTQVGGSIRIIGPNPGPFPDATLELPATGWLPLGRDGFRFRSPSSPCDVKVKPGRLSVKCRGEDFDYVLAGDDRPVRVIVTLGARPQLCMHFGGEVRGKSGRGVNLANAPAPEDCVLP